MADALTDLIANMTLADLARLGGKTASEIAAYALSGSAAARGPARAAASPKANAAPRKGRGGPAVRTNAGRGEFDAQVLAAIEAAGGPVRSEQIESAVGGNPAQRRAALHRLVAARKGKRAGRARATTYEAR